MPYILLIHIGPVQEFIAAARKTRDLAAASSLLSSLSAKGATICAAKGNLVFPALSNDGAISPSGLPNKLFVICDNPHELADEVIKAIKEELLREWNKAIEGLQNLIDVAAAENQILDLPQIYWVAVGFDEASDDYLPARLKAEYLLAARKSTRNFGPVTWGSDKVKSSLDGLRESVIIETNLKDAGGSRAIKQLGLKFKTNPLRITEHLCAPGILKRNRARTSTFPGTAHFAALPFLLQIDSTRDASDSLKRYTDYLSHQLNCTLDDLMVESGGGKFLDGRYLFESELAEEFADDPYKLEEARNKLNELFRDLELGRPSPYYAILVADGDDIGEKLAEFTGPDEHKSFSRKLIEFASASQSIVARNYGKTVYAGGDDILAFLPLTSVLSCAKELSETFNRSPGGTLSIGVGITHYIEPLSDALALARRAEHEAKSVQGKNALSICVDKRSGAVRSVTGKTGALCQKLEDLIHWEQQSALSHQAAYQIRDLLLEFNAGSTIFGEATAEIFKAEAARILTRKVIGDSEISLDLDNLISTNLPNELLLARMLCGPKISAKKAKA